MGRAYPWTGHSRYESDYLSTRLDVYATNRTSKKCVWQQTLQFHILATCEGNPPMTGTKGQQCDVIIWRKWLLQVGPPTFWLLRIFNCCSAKCILCGNLHVLLSWWSQHDGCWWFCVCLAPGISATFTFTLFLVRVDGLPADHYDVVDWTIPSRVYALYIKMILQRVVVNLVGIMALPQDIHCVHNLIEFCSTCHSEYDMG